MVSCPSCQLTFRNYIHKLSHVRNCFPIDLNDDNTSSTHDDIRASDPMPLDIVPFLNSTSSHNPPLPCPNEQSNQLQQLDLSGNSYSMSAMRSLDKRYSPAETLKRVLLIEEARIAAMWTNKNYAVLSQLTNSLSLSQSDINRVLSAVSALF